MRNEPIHDPEGDRIEAQERADREAEKAHPVHVLREADRWAGERYPLTQITRKDR